MGYITKFDGNTDSTVTLGAAGSPTSLEGYFLGSKTVKSDYNENGNKLHLFQTQEGTIGVWGKSRLDNLLTKDIVGQMCLVTFTGMIAPSKKGRRPSYGYKLQHDPENTTNNVYSTSSDNEDGDNETVSIHGGYSNDDDSNVNDEPEYVAPIPAKRPASVPSQAQQSKVQALVGGLRK